MAVDGQFYINDTVTLNGNKEFWLRSAGAFAIKGYLKAADTVGGGSSGEGVVNLLDYVQVGDTSHSQALDRALAIAGGPPIVIPYNGGTVYTFNKQHSLPSNCAIFGEGGKPNLKLANGAANGGRLFLMNAVSNVVLSTLSIDGNKANTTSGPIIDCEGATDCLIDNVDTLNIYNEIRLYAGTTGTTIRGGKSANSNAHGVGIDGTGSHHNQVIGRHFDNNVGFGIILTGGCNRNLIQGNWTTLNGIELIGITYENWGNRVIGNHAEGTGDNGISITGYENLVDGNTCIGCYHTGIYVYGHANTVSGNFCANNNQRFLFDGSQNFGGILVTPAFGGSGYDNTITGNTCIDDQATPTQAYGIRFTTISYVTWTAGDSTHFAAARNTCVFGTNVYFNSGGGTTGATPPTHTTGTVSDGSMNWTFLFGLNIGETTLGASGNSSIGNSTRGNAVKQEDDGSGCNNIMLGGNNSQFRGVRNIGPVGNVAGVNGDVIIRHGAANQYLAIYVNGSSTPNNTFGWSALQPRSFGALSVRPGGGGGLGSGFEGSQFFNTDRNRLEISAGAAFGGGQWVDGLGRLDPATGVSAAGTNIGTATQLSFQNTVVGTVGAGQGCVLPIITHAGMEMEVFNDGANSLLLYPDSTNSIGGLANGTAIAVPSKSAVTLKSSTTTNWRLSNTPGQYLTRTDNTDASPGAMGEFKSNSLASGSSTALTVSVVSNITSVVLDPGEWDLAGVLVYNNVSGTGTVANVSGGINTVNNAMPAKGDFNFQTFLVNTIGNNLPNDFGFMMGPYRVKLAAQTTYYLNTFSFWTGSVTLNAYGTIRARRI